MDPNGNDKLAAISAEAARWFVQLRDGKLNIAGQYQYLLWLKESPVHVAEMLRACQLYVLLQTAKLEAMDAGAKVSGNVIALGARENADAEATRADVRRWKLAAAVAAFVASASLAVVAMTSWRTQQVATDAGEWRILTLADGSVLRMGPRSRLRIDFHDSHRSVHFDHGEARFQVARHSGRPFIVRSELATVRAVGTDFAVERRTDRLILTVAEGAVAVTSGDKDDRAGGEGPQSRFASLHVSADQQVSIAGSGPGPRRAIDAERALAWADGWLFFDGETWGEAVEEFNRRNKIQLILEDQKLRQAPIRGRFEARDPEAFAKTLAGLAPLQIVRDVPGLLRLEPQAPSANEPPSPRTL